MAQPVTLPFGQVIVTIDDGTGTNKQVAPCGFLKKSVKFTSQSSDTIVPDCADPDAAAWVQRNVVSLSCEITDSGVLAMEDTALWIGFWLSATSRKCIVSFGAGDPSAATPPWPPTTMPVTGGFAVEGNFILTDWSLDADKKTEGGRTQQSVTLQSDGALTFVPAPTMAMGASSASASPPKKAA